MVMPPLFEELIAQFGWRAAFAIAGLVVLLVPVPVVGLFLKESPQRLGLEPDGLPNADAGNRADGRYEGFTWREIYRDRQFWLLLAGCVLLAISINACIIHLPTILMDAGAAARAAALASSTVGLGLLVGRIGCGYFLDRYFGPRVAAVIAAIAAIGIAWLWLGSNGPWAVFGAFLVGLGFGAEVDIMAYLMSRYFGLRSFGTAFGFGFGAFILAAGAGPLLMGIAFDHTGSYAVPMATFVAATCAAAMLMSRLGPYRFKAVDQRQKEQPSRPA